MTKTPTTKRVKMRWSIAIMAVLLLFIGYQLLHYTIKKQHPNTTIRHTIDSCNLTVTYNAPYRKGQKIVDGVVPLDQVWFPGIRKPPTFSIDKALIIDGSLLPEGNYAIWIIPKKKSWKIIFNSKTYSYWDTAFGSIPDYHPEFDVLTIEVPKQLTLNIVEQFSVYFEDTSSLTYMYLAWKTTVVVVPITRPKAN